MLFDSHCHLNDGKLYPIFNQVVREALENDVGWMVCIGYGPEANRRALEISQQYPNVFAAIGFHPEVAHTITEQDWETLEMQIKTHKIVAIGECGLDNYWDKTRKTEQVAVFKRQIQLAIKYDLPLIVHMREATQDTYEILKTEKPLSLKGVMHCYSGSVESMFQFIDLNMNISIAGPVTFKNAKLPKEIAAAVPDARMMIETDSPYLTPHPNRGKDNGPQYLKYICAEVASLKGMTYSEVAEISTKNSTKLFRIDLNS